MKRTTKTRSIGSALGAGLLIAAFGVVASNTYYFGDGAKFGPGNAHYATPGVVLAKEYRFDPAVQRMLAERSLKAMPLRGGELFYVIPVDVDPRMEAMQIRYIEALLDKKAEVEPDAR